MPICPVLKFLSTYNQLLTNDILDQTNVNWRFRNIEETHAHRWMSDATRMLDEIVDHQNNMVDETKKKTKWFQ